MAVCPQPQACRGELGGVGQAVGFDRLGDVDCGLDLARAERLLQVADQVGGGLQANREPQQIGGAGR